jgi:cytoskeletal protein CcmA (bactofilin family)
VIAGVVSAATVQSLGYTSSTRASVQSQAAADAGIAKGRVLLSTGTCTQATVQSSSPHFRLTVWSDIGGSWAKQCPNASTSLVRLISTGYATSNGANSQSAGDTGYQELVLSKQVIASSGAAVYLASDGFANAFSVTTATGESADVRVLSGNFSCTSSGLYEGNVIVAAGDVTISNPCTIKGYIWASGKVTIQSGATILGDITSGGPVYINGGTTITGSVYSTGNFEIRNGATIGGSVEATGTAIVGGNGTINGSLLANYVSSIEGKVGGNVTSAAYASAGSGGYTTTVTPGSASNRRVGGNLTLGGTLSTWVVCGGNWTEAGYICGIGSGPGGSGSVAGTVTSHVSGIGTPSVKPHPTVPSWVDVSYKQTDWQSSGFNQVVTLTGESGTCQFGSWVDPNSNMGKFWSKMNSVTVPTVFDARTCNQLYFNSVTLTLKANITIIGKSFGTNSFVVQSDSATARQFNLIVPDTTENSTPTCSSGNISFGGSPGVTMKAPVYGMAYSPCTIGMNNGSVWRGQMYSGKMTYSAGDKLVFLPVGIPGVNLDNIASTSTSGTYEIMSSRNRPDDGE